MKKETDHGKLRAILAFFIIFFSLLGVSDVKQRDWLNKEIKAFEQYVDDDAFTSVVNRTNSWFYYINENMGLREWLMDTFIPETNSNNPGVKKINKLAPYLARFANNIQNNIYLILYRSSNLFFWVAMLWPLLLAVLYDGYNMWEIKRYSFGQIDSAKYAISKSSTTFVAGLLLVYIFAPIPLSDVAVLLPLIVLVLLSLVFKRTIIGYKKVV